LSRDAYQNEEFYFVSVSVSIENNLPLVYTGSTIKEVPEEETGKLPDNVIWTYGYISAPSENDYLFVFDENKKLLSFEIDKGIIYDDGPEEKVSILSAKEMTEVLHTYFKDSVSYKKINIENMELCYTVQQVGVDDDNIEKYCLVPVWKVSYFQEKDSWYSVCYFNAVTGEFISWR
jgi:hypothetical protein